MINKQNINIHGVKGIVLGIAHSQTKADISEAQQCWHRVFFLMFHFVACRSKSKVDPSSMVVLEQVVESQASWSHQSEAKAGPDPFFCPFVVVVF